MTRAEIQRQMEGEYVQKAYCCICPASAHLEALLDWSSRAAQEIQEFLDAAREAGCDLPSVQELLDELDAINVKHFADPQDSDMEDADGRTE